MPSISRIVPVAIVSVAIISWTALFSGCGSKTRVSLPAATVSTGESDLGKSESAPGAQSFIERDLPGKAYSIDGARVQAKAIITNGESRRPMFLDATTITYSTRRPSVERWQVFAADLSKRVERRVSFDAGDAEPVSVLGQRLVIASSSDERKSGERMLNHYQEVFIPKEKDAEAKPRPKDDSMQHLMLEHPAFGRKGTEWNRISYVPAQQWTFSADKELKQAIAIGNSPNTQLIFNVTISGKPNDPQTRQWSPIQVAMPEGATGKILDGRIFPDGKRAVWSNGSILWTTNLKGTEPLRIGDDKIRAPMSLAIDPSGQWIVFSSQNDPADSGAGFNLLAVHHSGRCLKTLTELSGDELEPAFSPNGQRLLFIEKQADSSAVAEIPFGTPEAATAACP